MELARLRNHHANWRTALIDWLQEGFFLCDEDGAVVEINTAFTAILGFGAEGLPYTSRHPWWPDSRAIRRRTRRAEAFDQVMRQPSGSFVIPVTHRDGTGCGPRSPSTSCTTRIPGGAWWWAPSAT